MEYFTLQSDLSETTLESRIPSDQNDADCRIMDALFSGTPFPKHYVYPIDIKIGSRKQKKSDIDLLTGVYAVSPRMQAVINHIASEQVQFIPIHHQPHPETKYQVEDTYAWMNVLNRVPCLEFVKGEVKERRKFWNAQTRVWQERDPAVILAEIRFHPEKVEGLHIFRPDEFFPIIAISSVLHDALVKAELIALSEGEDRYRLVLNAATASSDLDWLQSHITESGALATLTPRRDLAMIALQGPASQATLTRTWPDTEAATAGLRPFHAVQHAELFLARHRR